MRRCEWLVAEAVRRSGGALAVDGVRGTLFGPITVRRLAYETSGLLVVLEDMTVDASPREMARGRLTVRSLEARTLRFESKPSPDPVRAPDSLALPLPVSIARAAIQEADLQGYKVRGLTFGYEGGADQQSVRALSAVSDDGHVEIDLRVGAHAPFELAGAVALRGKGALGDWTANAKLSGNLARAALVEASATAHGARAGGTARIAAFEPRWLEEFLVKLEDVDPAAFDARVPHAQLAIDISGAGTPDGLPAGRVHLANRHPGMLAAGRVPLVALDADYRVDGGELDLSRLNASLGAAGSIAGSARISASGGSADLTVSALDLRRLHAPLRATRLNGSVRARFTGADQRVQAKLSERGISFVVDATRRGDVVSVSEFQAVAGAGEVARPGRNLAREAPAVFGHRVAHAGRRLEVRRLSEVRFERRAQGCGRAPPRMACRRLAPGG